MYHDPTPKVFSKHIAYLACRYTFIALDTLVTALHQKDFSLVPPKSVVITIDDGHRGNFELLPIFKQYQIHPTLYVCTQIVNTYRHFWFQLEGQSKAEKENLKRVPNYERLARLKKAGDFEPEKVYCDRQALNITEMEEMAESVDFQSHTQFHPILPHCTAVECQQEILGSKTDLETLLGKACSHFSYPNGDWTEREVEIVRSGGFCSARTTEIGWNTLNTSPYRLRVLPMTDDAGLTLFRAELTTIPQRFGRWVTSLLLRWIPRSSTQRTTGTDER